VFTSSSHLALSWSIYIRFTLYHIFLSGNFSVILPYTLGFRNWFIPYTWLQLNFVWIPHFLCAYYAFDRLILNFILLIFLIPGEWFVTKFAWFFKFSFNFFPFKIFSSARFSEIPSIRDHILWERWTVFHVLIVQKAQFVVLCILIFIHLCKKEI
jgi:hypothetical protein